MSKDIAPVCANLFRMKAKHGIAIAWITVTDREHGIHRTDVNARNEYLPHPSSLCSGDDLVKVGAKFLTIKVSVSVDEHFFN